MKDHFKNEHMYYFGNVFNPVEKPNKAEILDLKENSNKILFIGNTFYLSGAIELCKAVGYIKENRNMDIELHFISLIRHDFPYELQADYMSCHGYLDKSIPEDREDYYSLIKNAKIVVNTTPKWAGLTSILESMYFYTPIITNKNDNFKKIFGDEIQFGQYCDNHYIEIAEKIMAIWKLSKDEYSKMCESANFEVKDFTWDKYVENILTVVNEPPCCKKWSIP
jgi:glycosyltransferase involved in cell wall biosynthesis